MSELNRFLLIGFLNTFLGYGLFLLFLRVALFSVAISNFLSYFLIIAFSFSVYRKTVFRSAKKGNHTRALYMLSFFFSFTLNQIVLYFFSIKSNLPPEIYQMFAMATYTFVFFFLNKHFVFDKT
tara:strand:+ start:210 stop:581 length:372 start_codon:yes stop_codon:yes gene_type:complete